MSQSGSSNVVNVDNNSQFSLNRPRLHSTSMNHRRTSLMSICHTRMCTRNFTNFWSIEQFSVQQELHSPGECIVARKFGDDNYEFVLKLFPNGKDEENSGYLSLFLQINKCPQPRLQFRVSFTVETLDGPRNCALNKNVVTINRSGIVTASKFFSNDVLKSCAPRYLPDDVLTIGVELTVFGDTQTTSEEDEEFGPERGAKFPRLDNSANKSSAPDGLLGLLQTGDFSDFTITSACGREFPVHQCILASRSHYFGGLFRCPETKEVIEKQVKFEDISAEVIEMIVLHIYSPETARAALDETTITIELMMAADRFMIDSLKDECAVVLSKGVTRENVVSRMQLADSLRYEELLKHLSKFFVLHKAVILEQPEWAELRKTNAVLVARVLEEAVKVMEASPVSLTKAAMSHRTT